MRTIKFLLLAIVAWLSICPAVAGKLFGNGKSRYRIVVAADASQSELTAAEELQLYIEKLSGAKLEVLSEDNASTKGRYIFVGYNENLGEMLGVERPAADDESFTYRSVGDDLWIYGGSQRGTMYGVYSFVERELGVRWYTRDCTLTPELKKWSFKELSHSEKPAVEKRMTDYFSAQHDDFLAHNKLNSVWGSKSNKYGGLVGFWGAHTFSYFVPEDKYFSAHPEYYSLVDGVRKPHTQLCLSNPEVLEICKKGMKKAIEENPDYWVYSLSQNDNLHYCQCEKCKALADKYGGQSGLMIWFANQVADYIKEFYPEKYISTFAYQYTRRVPKNITPRDNIVIRLCSIEFCFCHPLDGCDYNKPFMRDIKGWAEIASKLYIWDYVTNFRHYLLPLANFYVLADNIKTFIDNNVIGVYEEGVYNSYGGAWAELRTWVIGKLLWNPDQDVKPLVEEFIRNYYGAAAPYVQQYFDYCHAQIKDDSVVRIFDSFNHPFFTDEFIAESSAMLEKARQAVENESDEMKHRVDLVRLQPQYLRLMRHPQQALEDGTYDHFVKMIRTYKIKINEWTAIEPWIEWYNKTYLGRE